MAPLGWLRRPWESTVFVLNGDESVADGRIELPRERLPEHLREASYLATRISDKPAKRAVLRMRDLEIVPNIARVSTEQTAQFGISSKDSATGSALEVRKPTMIDWIQALPGPGTWLAVSTLVTAVLVAAPLVVRSPSPAAQRASSALIEVRSVDPNIDSTRTLSDRLSTRSRQLDEQSGLALRLLAGGDPAINRGGGSSSKLSASLKAAQAQARSIEQDAASLVRETDGVVRWRSNLRTRANAQDVSKPLDVMTKLSTLVTAILAFVVAYLSLRPGH